MQTIQVHLFPTICIDFKMSPEPDYRLAAHVFQPDQMNHLDHKQQKCWTWIGPVILRGGGIGRTDAKRAVSRRTFGGIQQTMKTDLAKGQEVTNRLNIRESGTVTQLNLRVGIMGFGF